MKILIIVLLIAAIGAAGYFYFGKKQNHSSQNSADLILGKWKIDSIVTNEPTDSSKFHLDILSLVDSSLKSREFEFRKDSLVLQTQDGKVEDSSHYEFADNKNLLIWNSGDTTKERFSVTKLDSTMVILKDKDSASFYFRKLK